MYILYRNGSQIAQSGNLEQLLDIKTELETADKKRDPNEFIRYEIRAYDDMTKTSSVFCWVESYVPSVSSKL